MRIKTLLSIVLVSTILLSCESSKKVSEVVYDKYNGKDGFSILVLPPSFVNKFVSDDESDQKELLKTVEDFRIMFFDNEVDGKSKKTVQEEITQLLDKRNFEDFMSITKDGNQISIKGLKKNDLVREMHVLIGGEDKFIMASFTGKIDFDKVVKTANDIDFDDFDGIGEFSGDFDFDDFKFIF